MPPGTIPPASSALGPRSTVSSHTCKDTMSLLEDHQHRSLLRATRVQPTSGTPDLRHPRVQDLGPRRGSRRDDPYGYLGSDARRDALDQGRDLRVLPHPLRRRRTHAGRWRASGLQGRRQFCDEAGLCRCLEDHRHSAQDLCDRELERRCCSTADIGSRNSPWLPQGEHRSRARTAHAGRACAQAEISDDSSSWQNRPDRHISQTTVRLREFTVVR